MLSGSRENGIPRDEEQALLASEEKREQEELSKPASVWFKKPLNVLLCFFVGVGFFVMILVTALSFVGHISLHGFEICPDIDMTDLIDSVDHEVFRFKSFHEKRDLFQSYKQIHGRVYKSDEIEAWRYEIFLQNLETIDDLNKRSSGAKYGITKFSDMTAEEFSSMNLLQFNKYQDDTNKKMTDSSLPGFVSWAGVESKLVDFDVQIPCNFDWREKGGVTEVRNQGLCGDCFSFATVGNVEGVWFLRTGQLIELSEQELTSCGVSDDSFTTATDEYDYEYPAGTLGAGGNYTINGCQGGSLAEAFSEVYENGLVPEDVYPFQSFDGYPPECDFELLENEAAGNQTVRVDGWTWILDSYAGASIDIMKRALMSIGPLAVGINADQMQFYVGGVDRASFCRGQQPNHAVLIVGFGYSRQGNYWIIKNSWGTEWGDNGYYLLSTKYGACNINQMVTTSFIL